MTAVSISILTVSDGVVRGTRDDASGRAIVEWARAQRMRVVMHECCTDDTSTIAAALLRLAATGPDAIITTGGTGLTVRDVTPEATAAVVDRMVPGIAEAIRAAGAANTAMTWLSRGIAGTRGRTLIVNLPGSTSGVEDGLAVLGPLLPHAVQLLRGNDTGRHPPATSTPPRAPRDA